MAPDSLAVSPVSLLAPVGPHASYIQVARPYVFEQKIQECMTAAGVNEVKEDSFRLQGVTWIDSVRKALHLPVRTFNTAVVYYHKFRLAHPDNEYNYVDAAAAALFTACKVEDTLKKSKDILCAAYNLKVTQAEQVSSDDPIFELHSKAIIGLERLMLEASGFDFRNRYPQKVLIKLAKEYGIDREVVAKTAYDISIDLYRTFTPLKQASSTMAMACLELSARIHEVNLHDAFGQSGFDYRKWSTSREEVMETILDLLDLYTHHRSSTTVGPQYPLDIFLAIRITLNHEATSHNYPRYTQWQQKKRHLANGNRSHDGYRGTDHSPKHRKDDSTLMTSPHSRSPGSSSSATITSSAAVVAGGGTTPASTRPVRTGDRGRDGTVRFMLDADRAREEQVIAAEYFKMDEEEYEVEEEIHDDVADDDGGGGSGSGGGGGGAEDGRGWGGQGSGDVAGENGYHHQHHHQPRQHQHQHQHHPHPHYHHHHHPHHHPRNHHMRRN